MIMTHTMLQNWEKRHWCRHGGLHGLDKVPSLRWWCTIETFFMRILSFFKEERSMVACWSNGLSAWHIKVRIMIIKMSTWSRECPHPREKQKHSKTSSINRVDPWWMVKKHLQYNWPCNYNNCCSLLWHCSRTTHLLMGLCEPNNAHPLETHYDSFVDEPTNWVTKVPHQ
jgi:hypothetical protein